MTFKEECLVKRGVIGFKKIFEDFKRKFDFKKIKNFEIKINVYFYYQKN